ncbi:MAG: hypothetical protein JWM80_1126 [Cyanobacteria bacterium RYN_339]|nr:hypothetical protein [Cyanobacteria bacterium RYN_339]
MKLVPALAAATCILGLAAPVFAADPPRATLREGKADYHDKELALFYGFGPGTLDFAFTDAISLGVSMDQVFAPQNWGYRGTWRLFNSEAAGMQIALNGGVLQTRERLAGDVFQPPVWGWQGGFLVSLQSEAGLTFRCGFQLYDTNWGTPDGQGVLISPEIAYRMGLVEVSVIPSLSWPPDFSWVGLRLRI